VVSVVSVVIIVQTLFFFDFSELRSNEVSRISKVSVVSVVIIVQTLFFSIYLSFGLH
jgi:hypothetical protein